MQFQYIQYTLFTEQHFEFIVISHFQFLFIMNKVVGFWFSDVYAQVSPLFSNPDYYLGKETFAHKEGASQDLRNI